jgi:hypothetical protein
VHLCVSLVVWTEIVWQRELSVRHFARFSLLSLFRVQDACVMLPLSNNAGLVMVICDGHFPESGKKPFDNCTARAGPWISERLARAYPHHSKCNALGRAFVFIRFESGSVLQGFIVCMYVCVSERVKDYFDVVLRDTPDKVQTGSGQAEIQANLTAIMGQLDEEFSRDQVDAILRHACLFVVVAIRLPFGLQCAFTHDDYSIYTRFSLIYSLACTFTLSLNGIVHIRFACQEKFAQRGILTKKGPTVSADVAAQNPYLTAPLPAGVPCDDGCTCVMTILTPNWLISCNVGDSRLTVLRSSDLSTGTHTRIWGRRPACKDREGLYT